MIANQWYVVLESKEVGRSPVGFLRMGERMVFWRDSGGAVACHADKCAHRGASLAQGRVLREEAREAAGSRLDLVGGRIQCPFHGIEYDASGRATVIPANGRGAVVPEGFRLTTYPSHEANGFIWIWWGEREPEARPAFFEDIPEGLPWSTRQDPWDNHYSRSIENQLDVAHLPFVHYNTIGRGNKTLVDGPGILFRDEGFFVYTYNRVDDGTPPLTSAEVPVPKTASPQKLEFRFPNLWQNYVSEKLRIVAAFVPVDSERTILYLRFYQGFMRIPLLKGLVHTVGNTMNLFIAHQDRRIVNTQLPKDDGMGAGELLFPGDRAIMEYRKLRSAAKSKNGESARL
jgi:phenylpropionate dioxygenase-like ring-hydroxylating dioxygenase large terminal subunit